MVAQNVEELARRIEAAGALDTGIASAAAASIAALSPTAAAAGIDAGRLSSAETVLHLLDRALPGWSIHLEGTAHEPDGHWSCRLRSTGLRDNDEFIGHGKGPGIANALLSALLRTLAYLEARAGR